MTPVGRSWKAVSALGARGLPRPSGACRATGVRDHGDVSRSLDALVEHLAEHDQARDETTNTTKPAGTMILGSGKAGLSGTLACW